MKTRRACLLAVVWLCAGCGDEPATLAIRLRGPGDPGLFTGVGTLVLSVLGQGARPLVLREFPASTLRLQLGDVPYGANLVFLLEGLVGVEPIVRGRSCPVDILAGRALPAVSMLITRVGSFAPTTAPIEPVRRGPWVFARGDGSIVVAGGETDGGQALGSVESFDPRTGLWTSEAGGPDPRLQGEMAPLPEGGAILLGGLDARGELLETLQSYRPGQGWSTLPAGRDVSGIGIRATPLLDGRILVTGGAPPGGPARASATFIAADGSAQRGGTLFLGRRHHTVSVVGAGGFTAAYVIGGDQGGDVPAAIGDIEVFDPRAPALSGFAGSVGSLNAPRAEHTATVLDSGEVLVVGGRGQAGEILDSAETFDPITRSVTAAGRLERARWQHTATLLGDGRVLVTGGLGADGQPLRSSEIYDPTVRNFVSARPLGTARANHRAIELCDGTVFIVGGGAAAEIYNPARL